MTWSLPGPMRFAATVRAHLERGSSALVGLPATLIENTGFLEGLRGAVDVYFDIIDGSHAEGRPISSIVAEQLGIDDVEPGPGAAVALAQHPMVLGRCVAIPVSGKPEEMAPWTNFIRTFLAATRLIPTESRPVLLVTGGHACATELATTDLAELWWWGVLNRLDTACFVQELLADRDRDQLLRDTITEVVGYDLDLASYLAREWDGDASSLSAALAGYTGPDWPNASLLNTLPHTSTALAAPPAAVVPLWDLGLADSWDTFGVYLHACTITAEKNQLRIWRAQLRYLMPLIDEERARIEVWLRHEVRGLEDSAPLEPGHLYDIMQQNSRLKSWRGGHRNRLVTWLRNSRNTLAHMETLPPHEVSRGKRLIWEDHQRD